MLGGAEDGQQMAVAAAGEGVAGDDDDIDVGEDAAQFRRGEGRGDTASSRVPVPSSCQSLR